MIKIGEKLNSSIPSTLEAMKNADAARLKELITMQSGAGADFLDINTALCDNELEMQKLLIELTLQNSQCGIVIDTPDPSIAEKAAEYAKGRPLILNSVTANERHELFDIAKKYSAGVVCLPIGEGGIPRTPEDRLASAETIIEKARSAGIEKEKLYIDILAEALAVDSESALVSLSFLSLLREKHPEVNTTCGLSNISFGLPKRAAVNAAFLTLAMAKGLSSAIMDVCSPSAGLALRATEALLGKDEYCMEYIGYIRENIE